MTIKEVCVRSSVMCPTQRTAMIYFSHFCQKQNESFRRLAHSRRTPNVLTDCSNMSCNYCANVCDQQSETKYKKKNRRNKKISSQRHTCVCGRLCERKEQKKKNKKQKTDGSANKLNAVFLLSIFMFSPYWESHRFFFYPCVMHMEYHTKYEKFTDNTNGFRDRTKANATSCIYLYIHALVKVPLSHHALILILMHTTHTTHRDSDTTHRLKKWKMFFFSTFHSSIPFVEGPNIKITTQWKQSILYLFYFLFFIFSCHLDSINKFYLKFFLN